MKIYQLPVSAAQLAVIPDQERALIVVLGHAMNEINVLIKLFDLASVFDSEPRVLGHAHVCQAMVLGRAVSGKLHEAWTSLQKGYFRTNLAKCYADRLDEEGLAGLALLKNYFGRDNVVSMTRNNFAFHFSLEKAAHLLSSEIPTEDLSIYLGGTNGCTLYQFAEYVMSSSLIDAIDPNDASAAFQKLIDESGKVVSAFNAFAQRLLYAILERHGVIPENCDSLDFVEIRCVPQKSDIRIPFFYQ